MTFDSNSSLNLTRSCGGKRKDPSRTYCTKVAVLRIHIEVGIALELDRNQSTEDKPAVETDNLSLGGRLAAAAADTEVGTVLAVLVDSPCIEEFEGRDPRERRGIDSQFVRQLIVVLRRMGYSYRLKRSGLLE